MPSYAQSELNTEVTARVSGTFTAANFLTIANAAIREVLSEIDIRSSIRKSALSPNLFDEVYQYTCPSDLKRDAIIDIKPQIDRSRFDAWKLCPPEEFDRFKEDKRVDKYGDPVEIKSSQWLGDNFVAIERDDLVNKLLLSRPIDDDEVVISTLDSLTAGGGTWALFGDGTNLTADTDNYVKGNGSINWDISNAGGTTAGIVNASLKSVTSADFTAATSDVITSASHGLANANTVVVSTTNTLPGGLSTGTVYYVINATTNTFKLSTSQGGSAVDITDTGTGTHSWHSYSSTNTVDVSDYKSVGSILVWAYIASATNLTNFILRIGTDASNYYSITITTNNEGASFYAGWNLLRFDFVNKSTTGTPTDTACSYVAIYMTKDAAKVSETDYRFDNLVMKMGKHYDVVYYSRYLWQNSNGTYLEDATATTDLINCETDEYSLFILKTCQLMEEHLKNWSEADRFEGKYKEKKDIYVKNNPSQALPMIQEYYTMDN